MLNILPRELDKQCRPRSACTISTLFVLNHKISVNICFTFSRKFAWLAFISSWWRNSTLTESSLSNSSIRRLISGSAIIHLRRADGSSVRPTAPPSPFIVLLMGLFSCNCRKRAFSLVQAKRSFLNAKTIAGWFVSIKVVTLNAQKHVNVENNLCP